MSISMPPEAQAIAAEFPGWEAWVGLNSLWHARKIASEPIVMVHDNDPQGIREQIRQLEALGR